MAKIKLILFCVALTTGISTGLSQKGKIGHISTEELWEIMPDKAAADVSIVKHRDELNAHLTEMVTEFNAKKEALASDTTLNPESLVYNTKIQDLQALQQKIEQFKQDGENELVKTQQSLYTPIREKMQAAIDKVAEANGFDYIMDSSFKNLIYVRKKEYDIMPLVKKELGIE